MGETHADGGIAAGRYRLLGRLTPAGGERRFLARDPDSGALAELTLVADDEGAAALAESAEALRRAAGPGLPQVLDTVRDAERRWLVCPFVPALTCAEAGALMYGGLPARTVRALGGVLGAALARLHGAGTAHGAVTADAVLLRGDGPCLTRPRPERGGTREGDLADLARVLGQLSSEPVSGFLDRALDTGPDDSPPPPSPPPPEPVALPARLVGALALQAERALTVEGHDPPPGTDDRTLTLGGGPRADIADIADDADIAGDADVADVAPTAGQRSARDRVTARRTLLAGTVGVLAGAGGVAAWVAARGGTAALTGSREGDGDRDRAAAARQRVPRGTQPPVLWRYDGPGDGVPYRNDEVLTDVGADRVYLVEPPYVTALRLSDGRRVWRRDDTGIRTGGLRPLSDRTLVAVRRGRLLGLSAGSGRQLWDHRPELPSGWGELGIAGVDRDTGVVHLMADDLSGGSTDPSPAGVKVRVIAYDTRRAATRWEHTLTAPKRGNVGFGPLGDDELLLSVGQSEGIELRGISASDGERKWRHTHTWTADRLRAPDANAWSDAGSRRLFCSSDGWLYGAAFTAGAKPRWKTNLRDDKEHPGPAPLHIAGTRELRGGRRALVVTDTYQTVYAVDPRDGRELWRHLLERDRTFPPRKKTKPPDTATGSEWAGRPLLVGGREGVTALDTRTGEALWRFRAATEATGYTTVPAGPLALLTTAGSVYALRLS